MKMSNRISAFQCSPIRRLSPYAREAQNRGIKVYYLNIGQPDINTPPQVLEAVRSYDQSIIAYGNSEGREDLREALPDYYAKYGLEVSSDELLITTGGSEALQFAFMTLCDPYDEIIIPEPYYTNVSSFAHSAMVNLVPVTSKIEEGFSLPDISEFEKRITRKTGAILLCSPNNPTGHVYTKDELLQLLNLVKKHDIFLIVDEVYREFCYDGEEFTSVLAFPEFADRVVCVDSFSKRYSMCGSRIGALVSKNPDVLANALKLAQARLCPPEIEQVAARAALDTDDTYLQEVKAEYERRRDFIVAGLQKIDGVVCNAPKGAFYLVAELPVDNAEDFATFMLKDFSLDGKTVMVAPCEDFYETEGLGRKQVRIAYVLNTEDLAEALKCFEAGLKAYREKVLGEKL